MIIVDDLLKHRAASGQPIRVGLIGAGYSGKLITYQILTAVNGIDVSAIANRTVENAAAAYQRAGVNRVVCVDDADGTNAAIQNGQYVISRDYSALTMSSEIDVIVEATGTVDFGASVVLSAIEHGKHVVLMNVELDATVGPLLKAKANDRGLIYTNCDGDEPGVAMNMIRLVSSLGLEPVVSGNLKGLYDPYRNPDTQREFAEARSQKAQTMAHFADGTKLSMELTVLANAAGFGVAKRGMYGPNLDHVNDAPRYYADKIIPGGMVDYLCGAAPGNGAFVLGHTSDPVRRDYLEYLKMGEGPYYAFYTPFHLPQLEIPNTIARAVLAGDATVSPRGRPMCDSITVAKTDLVPGDTLDGMGGYLAYALIDNYDMARAERLLPIGVSEGCTVTRNITKDNPVTYDDVELPDNRVVDQLRDQQNRMFS